jgi:hypothetical protein
MLWLLDSKTHLFYPSEVKEARFQASLSSPAERNRARSVFKRFFPPRSLRRVWVLISLGQSLHVFDALSLIYSTSWYHEFEDASTMTLISTHILLFKKIGGSCMIVLGRMIKVTDNFMDPEKIYGKEKLI